MATVRPRQINADGTIGVYCPICEKHIANMIYKGFSSAVCEECATGKVSPVQMPQEELDHLPLYNKDEEPSVEQERVGLVQYIFKAIGFGKKKTDGQQPIPSEAAAKRKRRRGLFSEPDSGDAE